MEQPARIAFVCEGDAENDAFSGTAKYIVHHLRQLGHEVVPINSRVKHPWRAINAIRSFSPNRNRWRSRFRYGDAAFRCRSSLAQRALDRLHGQVDVVFQVGAIFEPPTTGGIPYVLYCDWNMALSIRLQSHPGLSSKDAGWINDKQRAIYAGAATIFTICDRLRQSFIDDYLIAPEKVVRAYPGANVDANSIPARPLERDRTNPPSILFIGKEFRRKGGDTLLEAFRLVRREMANARLVCVGVEDLEPNQPGVESLGLLRKSNPSERDRLLRAFAEADVVCLPSRHDPFPNVVREAMVLSLPCVTTDIWAFPEMVVDGETGFTVPVDNPSLLASRLIQILGDPNLARRMGDAARTRAEHLFTWRTCAQTIGDHLQMLLGGGSELRNH